MVPRRLRWWQASLGLVTGAVASQLAGAIPVVVVAAQALMEHGPEADIQPIVARSVSSFAVLGPSIALTGGTMAAVAVFTALLFRARPLRESLGFRRAHWLAFVAAPIGILGLGPTSDALRRLMQYLAPSFTLGALEGLDAVARSASVWAIVPTMALMPGFAEELLFRGMFQRAITNRVVAVIASGLLFALVHMDPHHVVAIIPLGLYLAWLGDRTNSVLVPMAAHMCNNAAAVVGARFVTAEQASAEPLDWWMMPAGILVTAACVATVYLVTKNAQGGGYGASTLVRSLAQQGGPALHGPTADVALAAARTDDAAREPIPTSEPDGIEPRDG